MVVASGGVEAGGDLEAGLQGQAEDLDRSGDLRGAEHGQVERAPYGLAANDPVAVRPLDVEPQRLLVVGLPDLGGQRVREPAGEVLAAGPRDAQPRARG